MLTYCSTVLLTASIVEPIDNLAFTAEIMSRLRITGSAPMLYHSLKFRSVNVLVATILIFSYNCHSAQECLYNFIYRNFAIKKALIKGLLINLYYYYTLASNILPVVPEEAVPSAFSVPTLTATLPAESFELITDKISVSKFVAGVVESKPDAVDPAQNESVS